MKTFEAVFYSQKDDAGPNEVVTGVLTDRHVNLTVVDMATPIKELPPITDFDMAFFGGGPYEANADDDRTRFQIYQMQVGLADRIPTLGLCLGAQILAKAINGEVKKADYPEHGLFDDEGNPHMVHLTFKGQRDPIFNGIDKEFPVIQMHKMTYDLSKVAQRHRVVVLGTGTNCHNQAFRVGKKAYGFQWHPEFTPESEAVHVEREIPDFIALGPNYLRDFGSFFEDHQLPNTTIITHNFLDIAGVPRP